MKSLSYSILLLWEYQSCFPSLILRIGRETVTTARATDLYDLIPVVDVCPFR